MPSSSARIEGFLGALLDGGLAAATVHQRYRSRNCFFGYLVDEGEIPAHPMERMRPPEIPEHRVPVLTGEEIRALLATAKSREFLDVRDAAIIRLLVDTGTRRAELLVFCPVERLHIVRRHR